VEFPHSGGQTVGVIVGGLALVAIVLVVIGCRRKRTRKRKLNALLAKRYGSTVHFSFKTLSRIEKEFSGKQLFVQLPVVYVDFHWRYQSI